MASQTYYEVLTAAISDLVEHGFDSVERIARWELKIAEAARASLRSPSELDAALRASLSAIYKRLAEQGQLAKYHRGVSKFTLERVRPELRKILDQRIMASANLIRLNRDQAIQKTLQRFSGWATSIPAGGSKAADKAEEKASIKKPLARLKFEERRVLIDQGHKLSGAINQTVAEGGGAIALIWHSNWRQVGYNYREDHKDRDLHVYALKGSWAFEKGLAKPGPDGWYESITAVASEPFCRCHAEYLYSLRDLPEAMLTVKGKESLEEARRKIREEMA